MLHHERAGAASLTLLNKNLNIKRLTHHEPSYCRGAPLAPEPLALVAQYLTRHCILNKLGRVTRPALVCASSQTKIRVFVSS